MELHSNSSLTIGKNSNITLSHCPTFNGTIIISSNSSSVKLFSMTNDIDECDYAKFSINSSFSCPKVVKLCVSFI